MSADQTTDETPAVVALAARRRPVNYTVHLTQHWDDSLEVWVQDVADDPRSNLSVADALERAAKMLRDRARQSTPKKWATAPTVRFWWWVSCALAPLMRVGIQAPYGWAHMKWLGAHCRAVEREMARAGK